MDKVLLIIHREYFTRVRKKSFILMIFAVPLLVLIMLSAIVLVSKNNADSVEQQTVKVIDESGVFNSKLHDTKNIKFEFTKESIPVVKAELSKNVKLLGLRIPRDFAEKNDVQMFSKKKPSTVFTDEIERQMNIITINTEMLNHHIDTALVHSIKSNIHLNTIEITDKGDKETNLAASIYVGIIAAIFIYMSLFIYGAQVMRGVIEEKTSRIIEVIISSVKPFQLMLGKVIGVGLVGLTQFVAWIILSFLVTKLMGSGLTGQRGTIKAFLEIISTINVGYIMSVFLFYFLTGYLLYSALFAAVGSAVDNETETQQFMFPITMPLLFTYILATSVLSQNPDSQLAVWLSIIPFTAPVAMMVRIQFDVPVWQLALSMSLMIAGFIFTIYVAARIYRVGILMYGKKASFKELAKWFFYKE